MKNETIGYKEVAKKNGVLYFAVNDIEGLEVSFITEEKNLYNGKTFNKKHLINDFVRGTNNETGKEARLYNVAIHCGDIEIKLGNDTEFIKNSYDKSEWGL